VEILRVAGVSNFNLDLIFGIPGQSLDEWQADLDNALSLAPSHLSCYSMMYEPNTPLTQKLKAGQIQRIDEDVEGVRVIDYKTGRAIGYGSDSGAFDGGRRLQHAIYALAAEARLDGRVVAGEYHFPTRRGMNQHFRYDREVLTRVEALLDGMLEGVAAGTFVPTESADDCSFCDFADVCRARRGDWGKVSSPLAEWSEEVMNTGLHPAFATLRRTRRFEQ
jgi:hypothetical protein